MRILSISLLMLAAIAALPFRGTATDLDFLIIQPGQPGSSAETEALVSALSSYLEKKLGGRSPSRGST